MASNSEKRSNLEQQGQSPVHHDIFEDPAITRALKEDPLFKFLVKWWRQCLVLAVVVFVAWYAKMRFDEAALGRLAEGRNHLLAVQDAYDGALEVAKQDQLTAIGDSDGQDAGRPPEGEKPPLEKVSENKGDSTSEDAASKLQAARLRLGETRNLLSDSTKPYSHFSELYRSLELRFSPDKFSGKEPGLEAWKNTPLENRGQRLLAELEALALARIALDKPETQQIAEKTLGALVDQADYVHTAAAISLARALIAPQEGNVAANGGKDRLQETIQRLKQRKPEQAELIESELQGLLG